ncbi:Phage protein D [Minicystis rosea]|nr:Phage protein D [Minicystis rosea]
MTYQSRVAAVGVKINGQNLPAAAYADLLEVSVEEDIEAPSVFTLRLITWDESKLSISWADNDLFTLGNQVEVSFGYVSALSPLLTGEITGLDLDVSSGTTPILIVRGYDRRHRLLRGGHTRSFLKAKDSAIATQIAQEQGLTPEVVDTTVIHEHVLQHGQTDLEFLGARAEAIGYEVVVEGKTLHFRPYRNTEKVSLTLRVDRDVIEFHPQLSARSQAGEVTVRGWDPKAKAALVGKASIDDPSWKSAAGSGADAPTLGPKAADEKFGKAIATVVDRAVQSQAEADAIARGQLERMALSFIKGEGTCVGRVDLRAGIVVDLQGIGKRFGGAYYVTSVTHSFAPKRGYRTGFTVRRNAA